MVIQCTSFSRRHGAIVMVLFLISFVQARTPARKAGNSMIDKHPRVLPNDLSVRQALGMCPPPQPSCPVNKVCCPNICCEIDFPNCGENRHCVNDNSRSQCETDEGVPYTCTPCKGTTSTCGRSPPFTRCSVDADRCITEQGYMSCSEEGRPGVWCDREKDICCVLPNGCCPNSTNTCCSREQGAEFPREPVLPLLSFIPGTTPVTSGSIPPSPSESSSSMSPSSSEMPSPSPDISLMSSASASASVLTSALASASVLSSIITPSRSPRSSPPPILPDPPVGTCFSGEAVVELRNGATRTMRELRIGDHVRVSADEFSEVFMWTHRTFKNEKVNYVTLHTGDANSLTATAGHLLYRCRKVERNCGREIVQIEDVEAGDAVWIVKGNKEYTAVVLQTETKIASKGLFNPQTLHGDIVVNGVLCTCYTKTVQPAIAHSVLVPIRAIYLCLKRLSLWISM